MLLSGVLTGGILSLMAIGLNLTFGVLRIINFAHGVFVMLGMYFCYWLFSWLQINPYVSLVIGIPVFFILGIGIQKYILDRIIHSTHESQIILTLALAIFFESIMVIIFSADYRAVNLGYEQWVYEVADVVIVGPKLLGFLLALGTSVALYLYLKKSDFGKAIRASADNREGALIIGINVERIYYITFGIAIICAAVAGAILTTFFYIFPQVGMEFTLYSFVIVVIGGLGSFGGALLGGLLVGIFESVSLLVLPGALKQLVTFILLITVLIWRPEGLFGQRA